MVDGSLKLQGGFMRFWTKTWFWAVVVAVTLFVIVLTTPVNLLLHAITMVIRFKFLTIPTLLSVVVLIIAIITWMVSRSQNLGVSLIVMWLLSLFLWVPYSGAQVQRTLAASMEYQTLETLQQVETTGIRMYPLDVVNNLLKQKNRDSALKIGDIDPILTDDTTLWTAPSIKRGARWWSGGTDGFFHFQGNNAFVRAPFVRAEHGPQWTKIQWKFLAQQDYWVHIEDVSYIQVSQGNYLGFASYYSYEGLPFWGYKPYWKGVFTFDSDANITNYTAEQIRSGQKPFEQAVQYVPITVSEVYARAFANFRGNRTDGGLNGIFQVMFNSRNQLQIPHIPDSANQLPFLQSINNRPVWVFMLEPANDEADTLEVVFMQDAELGSISTYLVPQGQSLLGPESITAQMKAKLASSGRVFQNPDQSESQQFIILEPAPLFHGGKVYYKASLVPGAKNALTSTIISNSNLDDFRLIEYEEATSQDEILPDLRRGFPRLSSVQSTAQPQYSDERSVAAPLPVRFDFENLTDEQLHDLIDHANRELRSR